MIGTWWKAAALALLWAHSGNVALAMSEAMGECLLARIEAADGRVTVDELTSACKSEIGTAVAQAEEVPDTKRQSAVDIRRAADFDARDRRFVISTHRSNYFLYTYNNDPNVDPYGVPDGSLDKEEIKFQVSFKMPLATGLFGSNTDLLFGYTGTAWWQLFNNPADNPFRETNYEPEVFFRGYPQANIQGLDFISWELGINHQSNGQTGSLSRGWDRVIGSTAVELTDDLVLGVRAWHIIRRQDTNADLHRYMGYGDIGVGWVPNRHTITALYRPATEGDAVQFTWSYPISRYLRVYAQYWNGYGESLIDYNVRTKRWGVGLSLSDILARE
jgi:phospholipase A1